MSSYEFTADFTKFSADISRYSGENALVLTDCAKLSYVEDVDVIRESLRTWGLNKFEFFDGKETGTQAYIAGNDKVIIVAFRGTEVTQLKDLKTDAALELIEGPVGKVHKGFYRGLNDVWDNDNTGMRSFLNRILDNNQSVWFCGHSLGAALAALAAAEYVFKDNGTINGLYTIGQPRTGNANFAKEFDKALLNKTYRFINNNDIVTRVPLPGLIFKYTHVGHALYIDSEDKLHDSISWWMKGWDMIKGAISDIGKVGPDNLKDHSSERYVKLIEKNRHVTTKWS